MTIKFGSRVKTNRHNGWRSIYPIYDGTDLVAFVGMETGWGKTWNVYPLKFVTCETQVQVEGCAPNKDASFTPYASDLEDAVSILEVPSNRAKFKSRLQMIHQQVSIIEKLKEGTAQALSSTITAHGLRSQQRDCLRELLENPDFLVGNQRFVMTKLLQELTTDVARKADYIERTRKDLKRAEEKEIEAKAGLGITIGDLVPRDDVPSGTEVTP